MVRLVRELRDHILAYQVPEEPDCLEVFLGRVTMGVDSELRIALTLAMLARGQAAADATTRLLRELESRTRLASTRQAPPVTPARAIIDAELRVQLSLAAAATLRRLC